MSTEVEQPRDPEIGKLLESERSDPAYAAAKERLARRLAFTAIAEAASPSPRPMTGAVVRVARAGLLVALGIGAGMAIQAARTPTSTTIVVASPNPSPSPSPVPAPTPAPSPAPTPAPSPTLKATPPHPKPTPASTLAAEQRLIDTATNAVRRGAFTEALTTLDEDESQFTHGQLVEERELLRIQALVGAERREEAKRRAERFANEFPRSIFLPAIRQAVDTPPP